MVDLSDAQLGGEVGHGDVVRFRGKFLEEVLLGGDPYPRSIIGGPAEQLVVVAGAMTQTVTGTVERQRRNEKDRNVVGRNLQGTVGRLLKAV